VPRAPPTVRTPPIVCMFGRMFLFLSKVLPQFVYPVGAATLLLILALLANRASGWTDAFLLAAIASLWIGGNSRVARGLVRSLERRHLPDGELPQADAILLLGGGNLARRYSRSRLGVGGAGDRVLYAGWLYQQGHAPYILATGGNLPWSGAPSSPAAAMRAVLALMGVPESAVQLEEESANTYESSRACHELLEARAAKTVLLVTSAIHMPRSVKLFEKKGVRVIPAPTDFSVPDDEPSGGKPQMIPILTELLPNVRSLDLTTGALKEYLGTLVYRLRGWV
jgi:uncharacterized SAM-binding protein YcdF (DUF218 family)